MSKLTFVTSLTARPGLRLPPPPRPAAAEVPLVSLSAASVLLVSSVPSLLCSKSGRAKDFFAASRNDSLFVLHSFLEHT